MQLRRFKNRSPQLLPLFAMGKKQELLVAKLVPGDIIRLNAGDLVPADARLLKETDLQVRESALTGESLPVEKSAGKHPAVKEYEKVDEIPFDFKRKRLSVVVRHGDEHLLITKGEAESVFAICQTVNVDGGAQPFDESQRARAAETFQKLRADG